MKDVIIDLSDRRAAPAHLPKYRLVNARTREGDAVVIDADVALLLAQAFIDLANERRIVAMDLAGAEEINRAFQAIEKMGRSLT